MYRILLLCIMQSSCAYAYAQRDANWVFGEGIGLNFLEGSVLFFETNIFAHEASASISDTLGNLLFYTNGENVWNKENDTMENGDGLLIAQNFSGEYPSSVTQGVIILPKPSSQLFYLFHNYGDTMFFSSVDIDTNEGLGAVVEKNMVFYSTFATTEKMTAVKHANGSDWWLFLYEWPDVLAGDTNFIFTKFLISHEGISDPYQQIIGPTYHSEYGSSGIGQMKFNQEGNMLAVTSGKNVDLYDFDRCTGELSNWVQIPNVQGGGTYGCEFSPDGTKLYIGGYGSDLSTKVIQYCLDCEEEIPDTKEIIFQNIYNNYGVGQFQLAPDNKIYIALSYWLNPNYIYSDINEHLCVVNNPNAEGVACDFDTLTIDLGGHRNLGGLPNMVNYNLGVLEGSPCDTITSVIEHAVANNNECIIYPNPSSGIINFHYAGKSENATIHILQLDGTEIFSKNDFDISKGLNVQWIPEGFYFVQLETENNQVLKSKLIILKSK